MNKPQQLLIGIVISTLGCIIILFYLLYTHTRAEEPKATIFSLPVPSLLSPAQPQIGSYQGTFNTAPSVTHHLKILNASFLHNAMRNYYGDSAPSQLEVIWKHKLGHGTTRIGKETKIWRGAGWTGQPLLVEENGKKYLIQGAYDHHLKKIDAETGKLIWQYQFDDVIKGTGTIWLNPLADSLKHFCIILQGSRAGKSNYATTIPSYRAISYFTGEELWSLNSVKTASYSRDVDASALIVRDTAYIGLENSIFTVLDPNPSKASFRNKLLQPKIYNNSDTLYLPKDIVAHGGNLVTEASPALLHNHIYIASGSGHIWGYNLATHAIDWDYWVGSDIDGSPVVTIDNCLLISIEKQYIKGQGGLLKLNPSKAPQQAVEWFFPTQNKPFSTWEGGIIGSSSVNYYYKAPKQPNIAAFTAIDGFLYVVDTDQLASFTTTTTYDSSHYFPAPKLLFKQYIGPSISTPIIVQNKIIAASYKGIYLFEFDKDMNFKLKTKVKIRCESTPVVDHGRVYIASRNGYLYCLGEKDPPINN
ncbi:outer membrane protein assembly factor BamB family protein [Aureispira anguillae]|uniref:PQQ-binding-like beta-propeller repeat protein n=1 Tax=Aureispira anguillae TaxID=2864201 RepID=A0A915YJX8_9BACT|nr:PQQ-binding-like beta-propeller repeat protein [Aureispira anguillae]BDS14597.1 PQQ-binding-like beta-propeller repeat protein [Aureispira anguillae]